MRSLLFRCFVGVGFVGSLYMIWLGGERVGAGFGWLCVGFALWYEIGQAAKAGAVVSEDSS